MDTVVWNVVEVNVGNVVGIVLNDMVCVVLGVVNVVEVVTDEPVLKVRGG